MLKIFRLLILTIILSSCATTTNLEQEVKVISYELSSTHCTYNNQTIRDYRKNDPMALLFPSIPGGLWGNPTSDIIQYVSVIPNQTFSLVLPSDMSTKAKNLSQEGLSIKPTKTKVIRLGTFHSYPDYKNNIGGGGFHDKATGDFLILVYFSNVSTVTGMQKADGDNYEFNIQISRPGWNWVKSSKVGNNKYATSLYEGPIDNIEFCAYIKNAINT